MAKREYTSLGFPVYFSEVNLVQEISKIDKKTREETVVKPHFVSVWNEGQWYFRSKKTGKFYHYSQVLAQHGPFWKTNFEWVEKSSRYEGSSVFFCNWSSTVLYYNSFERYEEALKEYTGKPKGREEYAELEREKWFLAFKEM